MAYPRTMHAQPGLPIFFNIEKHGYEVEYIADIISGM